MTVQHFTRLFESSNHRGIKNAFGTNDVAGALLDTTRCGPFDGGCLVVALALQRIFGGEIVHVATRTGVDDHYGVLLPTGEVLDGDGSAPNAQEWVARFSSVEHGEEYAQINGPFRVEKGIHPETVVPRDDAAVDAVEASLRRQLGESLVSFNVPAGQVTTELEDDGKFLRVRFTLDGEAIGEASYSHHGTETIPSENGMVDVPVWQEYAAHISVTRQSIYPEFIRQLTSQHGIKMQSDRTLSDAAEGAWRKVGNFNEDKGIWERYPWDV